MIRETKARGVCKAEMSLIGTQGQGTENARCVRVPSGNSGTAVKALNAVATTAVSRLSSVARDGARSSSVWA